MADDSQNQNQNAGGGQALPPLNEGMLAALPAEIRDALLAAAQPPSSPTPSSPTLLPQGEKGVKGAAAPAGIENDTPAAEAAAEEIEGDDPRIKRANAQAARHRVEKVQLQQELEQIRQEMEALKVSQDAQTQQKANEIIQRAEEREAAANKRLLEATRTAAMIQHQLPEAMAQFITGADEKTINDQATLLAEHLAKSAPAPRVGSGSGDVTDPQAGAKELLDRAMGRGKGNSALGWMIEKKPPAS